MSTIRLSATAGSDGILHLDIPTGGPGVFDVQVTLTPKPSTNGMGHKPTPEELGWPPGFFENTFGSIDDPAFMRYPQGEYEERTPME